MVCKASAVASLFPAHSSGTRLLSPPPLPPPRLFPLCSSFLILHNFLISTWVAYRIYFIGRVCSFCAAKTLTHSTPMFSYAVIGIGILACMPSKCARCVLKRMPLFLMTRFESKKQSWYLRHCHSPLISQFLCELTEFLMCAFFVCLFVGFFFVGLFGGIVSSRFNTGNTLVWSELTSGITVQTFQVNSFIPAKLVGTIDFLSFHATKVTGSVDSKTYFLYFFKLFSTDQDKVCCGFKLSTI